MLLALCLLAGTRALFTSARSIYPRVAFPRIAVIAERGEAPVRGMLVAVTRPLEQAVSVIPDLLRVRSRTLRGASELSLDFAPRADMREALSLVRARIAAAELPADLATTIERQTPAVFPVISFNVVPGPEDAGDPVARARLAEWVELELHPRLARLPDAFFVTVQSGDRREYVFAADPLALARSGLDLDQVAEAIRAANAVGAVGRLPLEGLQYQLLVDGELTTPEQLLDIALKGPGAVPVPLRALGELRETAAERTQVVTGGGLDGVVVSVFLRDGGRVTDLSRDVERILAEIHPLLPGGSAVVPVYDQAVLVEASIAGVRDAIALGALLAVVVLALFLGDWRSTLVAGLSIPISMVLTLALFPALGESLNLMSLGGLAVAIGLMIDDAIVVVENVARHLEQQAAGLEAPRHSPTFLAVAAGTGEVVGAIVGSSLTTVVVFLPLVLVEGVVGQFFRSLSLALGIGILASMAVSLVWSPLLLLLGPLAPRGRARTRGWMEWLRRAYVARLTPLLERPWTTWTALGALVLLATPGLRSLATGFLPSMDEGGFVLDYTLPVGSSLEETDAACRRIERVLLAAPEVASFSRRTGSELGFFATEQFTGDFLVGLKPPGERERSVFELMDSLRADLAREVPQAEVEFIQVMQDTIADLEGNPEPIEVKLLGAEYAALQRAADDVATALEHVSGVVDVQNHKSFGSPELTWRPDALRTAALGLTNEALVTAATGALLGQVVTRVREGNRFVDVRVRGPGLARGEVDAAAAGPAVWLHPPGGTGVVPLSSVATFERSLGENELERENQTPMVRVTAFVAGGDLGSVARAVEATVGALPRDPAVRIEFGGQALSQRRAFTNLTEVFGLGAGLVFLLLVIQFRSLRLPAVMFLALPFGQLGALWALRLSGVELNISSGMGLILLVGLVVKNGIILIEYAQALCGEGRSERDAILEAARVRLRPVLMTTLASIAGLAPLALGLGQGSELQRPLAIAVIGGLVVSTAFTLLVVPLGCASLARGGLVPEERHGQ